MREVSKSVIWNLNKITNRRMNLLPQTLKLQKVRKIISRLHLTDMAALKYSMFTTDLRWNDTIEQEELEDVKRIACTRDETRERVHRTDGSEQS